jgi:hypothetical protein
VQALRQHLLAGAARPAAARWRRSAPPFRSCGTHAACRGRA